MKINLKDLTEKIENQDYIQDLETVKYAQVSKSKKKLTEYATKMVKEVAAALKHNSLLQTQLAIDGQRPVTFALETDIINLPYSNYKKISSFFEEDQEYPLYVYFETRSEYINVSGFRIDQLATEEEINGDADAVIAKLVDAMTEKLKQVREYEKPAPVKKSTAKTTTKKKKTTTRKKKSSK